MRLRRGQSDEPADGVFGAYLEKPTAAQKSEFNVAILRNLLDAVEATSPTLQHVTFYQGGKAYGADLGPFKTPAREDDPRLMPPNFYYDPRSSNKNGSAGPDTPVDEVPGGPLRRRALAVARQRAFELRRDDMIGDDA